MRASAWPPAGCRTRATKFKALILNGIVNCVNRLATRARGVEAELGSPGRRFGAGNHGVRAPGSTPGSEPGRGGASARGPQAHEEEHRAPRASRRAPRASRRAESVQTRAESVQTSARSIQTSARSVQTPARSIQTRADSIEPGRVAGRARISGARAYWARAETWRLGLGAWAWRARGPPGGGLDRTTMRRAEPTGRRSHAPRRTGRRAHRSALPGEADGARACSRAGRGGPPP